MSGLRIQGSLTKELSAYRASTIERLEDAVTVSAFAVMNNAVQSIQRGDKSGRVYRKYKPNRTHQASAPGEAPASDTGRLAGSITVNQLSPLTAEIGTLLDYGRWLEFGTMHIKERPWLRPSLEMERAEFKERVRIALRQRKT